jgi:hypothetical protein
LQDKETFYLNRRPFVVARFCKMAQDLVAETTEMLWALCWVDRVQDWFTIKLEQVVDNVTFTKRGMSFVESPGNRLAGGLRWMLTQAATTQGRQQLQRGDRQWDVKAMRQYMQQVDCFLEMLLCSVHVTSAQPGRGTEITIIQHRNRALQDCNIFIADRQIMTVVHYHKSQSQ